MKKTLNINLGGIAFIIDENAFDLLHNYLETLKTKFKNAAERDEILNDIEARIAEMLNQKLVDRKEIVSVDEVQSVIGAMGKPEDIAGEESATDSESSNTNMPPPSNNYSLPIKKRLFRDTDDAKVGGVISGLCHYFGISDPVWVRLAVIILCFVSFGTVLLIYFLLLLVIPKAQTSAEKLQMKGEPVNISTIEKEIRDAAAKAGESVNKFVGDETFFEKIWELFYAIIKGIFKLIAAFIIFIGLIVIFALLATLFGVSIAGNAFLAHAPHLLVDNTYALTIFKTGLVFFIGAPVIGLIYVALRLILGKRTQTPGLKWLLIVLWFIGIFLLAIGGLTVAQGFSTKATKSQDIALMQPANGNLLVQLTDTAGNKISSDNNDESHWHIGFFGSDVFINNVSLDEVEQIPIGKPSLELIPSANDSFYIQKAIISRGKNKGDALTNSGYITYNFSQKDTVLNLPAFIELDKRGKYRMQEMIINIAIPEGKMVSFADNIDRWHATVKDDQNYDDTNFANTTWTAKNGKVVCLKGENHSNSDGEDKVEVTNTKADVAHNKQASTTIKITTKKEKSNKDDND